MPSAVAAPGGVGGDGVLNAGGITRALAVDEWHRRLLRLGVAASGAADEELEAGGWMKPSAAVQSRRRRQQQR